MPLISVRLTDDEKERLDRAQQRLQQRGDPKVHVTQRYVLVAGLERLEAYLDKLDRDQERRR